MKNMASMMKQAQQMQKNMQNLQAELEKYEITGTAAGGSVSVTMTCKHKVTALKINPDVVDADDVETLEDLITVAFNDAAEKVETYVNTEVSKVTGGMSIPGLG
ncbi:MAG: YbaB/EbfC family nucleoid-associated protein [Magnetococcales bacterium]|nr:YbaB/EbfC family nucleoid-associated protein [Magnetococcales bacterium]MEC8067161.1 YbaB/EbfC family nucleoid-associated protein [Pseudomonadota bacterium]|tara:strand:+ start:8594 stop:8905 length:312 start_codon:yes stop_codon:yes gene_type:complete